MTIYGNEADADKKIEFHVWDGDKCNEYVEILEEIRYLENSLVGSPIEPQPIHVLNLVKKCLVLNKGWNWVSFNLDLGTGNNTVTNVLASLRNKDGSLIKDDRLFSRYYGAPDNVWKHTLTTITPQKRYLISAPEKDTVCLKGSPYVASQFPINIINGWNWVGYVPSTGMTVTQALRGLTPLNGDIIKSQTLFAQYVAGIGWVGNLNFLEPLKGYFMKISNAGTLIYPTTNSGTVNEIENAGMQEGLLAQAAQESSMNDGFSQYQSTMSMVAKVNGVSLGADDELRAYMDDKLVGSNKSMAYDTGRLFFETIYNQDQVNIKFKLYKADRKKEYELNKSVAFKVDGVMGLVNDPIVFELLATNTPALTLNIEDQVIEQPNKVFEQVSIPNHIVEANPNCTTFSFNTILPTGTEVRPTCNAQVGAEGNMNGVIKVVYNERSTFVSENDVLSFVHPTTGVVVGCGSFDASSKYFDVTIVGNTASSETPIDVKYYSDVLKKSFTLKAGVLYKNNRLLGDFRTPFTVDFSPLTISSNTSGVITTVMRDTSWTGKYCVEAFAMNCTGLSDGQTSFCFQRLKQGACVELIVRKITESQDKVVKALSISSEALINSGVKIDYQGGHLIDLKPGFDVPSGGVFTGKIAGCNNR